MMREEISQISFDCTLPLAIFFNDNLSPNCVKLYAMIKFFNSRIVHEYCFASNRDLSNLMGISLRSVKHCLYLLKKEGFILSDVEKDGIRCLKVAHIHRGEQ